MILLLKGWISARKTNPYKAYCKPCGKELVARLSELKKHASTKKHQESMLSVSKTRPLSQMPLRPYQFDFFVSRTNRSWKTRVVGMNKKTNSELTGGVA